MQAHEASMLMNAFRRGSLSGVLVHMTNHYFDVDTANAYCAASILLKGLRERGAPVSHTIETPIDYRHEITSHDLTKLDEIKRPHALTSPVPLEKIFPFPNKNGLENPAAATHLSKIKQPVFITAGVYTDECLRETVTGILRTMEDANIIIASDATNDISDKVKFARGLSASEKQRLSEATTAQILGTLDLATLS